MYQRRERCEGDVYHIVVRGAGRQLLFEDDRDNDRFLTALLSQAESEGVELYAWCLMGNHAHMLMHGSIEAISSLMQAVNRSYAAYFNIKYDRVGHLMQGRFRSVPVKDDAQLIATVVYIHRNPVEAGLSKDCRYRWSSYDRYLEPGRSSGMSRVLGVFGGTGAFEEAHAVAGGADAQAVVHLRVPRMSDSHAREVLRDVLSLCGYEEIPSDDKAKRNEVLAELRRRGLSIRQVERLTGIGRNIIAKAK